MNKQLNIILLSIMSMTLFQSCSLLNELSALQNVRFRIGSLSSVHIGGVSVMNKTKVTDFSVGETMSLASKVASKSLPLTLTVNLEAQNPNKEMGNDAMTNNVATLQSLEWRLLIDDVPTVSGIIKGPISIPPGGTSIMIPLATELDLFTFFESRGYAGMAKLAFALANPGSTHVSVKLDAKPVIQTFLGTMPYPSRITIIEQEFN